MITLGNISKTIKRFREWIAGEKAAQVSKEPLPIKWTPEKMKEYEAEKIASIFTPEA